MFSLDGFELEDQVEADAGIVWALVDAPGIRVHQINQDQIR
jgi:hypothetical protein